MVLTMMATVTQTAPIQTVPMILRVHLVHPRELCLTIGDEDGDGDADCLDTDCNGSPGYDAFGNLGLCQYAAELNCTDSMDNDGDLLIDCNDPELCCR